MAEGRKPPDPIAPKPTGRRGIITLTGCLIPWLEDDQPSLLQMPGSDSFYLPVFSTKDKLVATMRKAHAPYVKIKQIDDGPDFLDSIPIAIIVIKDPWFTIEGKVRFTQVER